MSDASKPPPLPRARNRKPWGKRFGWSLLALFLAAALGHAIWGLVEQHRFASCIAELKRAGEPIFPTDFVPAQPDGPDNAVNDLAAAVKMLPQIDDTWDDFQNADHALPLRPDEIQYIESLAETTAGARAALDHANDKSRADWPVNLSNPTLIPLMLPSLNDQRRFGEILSFSSLLEHQRGNDRVAMQDIERIFLIARIVNRQPSLVSHLVATGLRALACNTLNDLAPDLHIGSGPDDVSPQPMKEIFDLLLDDRSLRVDLNYALQCERMEELSLVNSVATGSPVVLQTNSQMTHWSPLARYLIRPIFYRNERLMMDYTTRVQTLSNETLWPAAQAKMPPKIDGPFPLVFLAQIFTPSLNKVVTLHFFSVTNGRLSATALAIRWYAIDHAGRLPARLADLVPQYLPSVPADPFAADGRAIAYHPDPSRPILYSVSQNETDDGGNEQLSNPHFHGRPTEWDMQDRVVHLTRRPRPAEEESPDDSAATRPTTRE